MSFSEFGGRRWERILVLWAFWLVGNGDHCCFVSSFTLTMMGSKRRGKGGGTTFQDRLENNLSSSSSSNRKKNNKSLGKGQEITGVTLPEVGTVKGWDLSNDNEKQVVACANVDGRYYAVEGMCPRCGFELYQGTIVEGQGDGDGNDNPSLACSTCATTYSLRTGRHGPPFQPKLGFVGRLAQAATANSAYKDAIAYRITVDEEQEEEEGGKGKGDIQRVFLRKV